MKNFLKYVAALAIVGAFFVACSDWTDPEREITQHPDQQSPILRDNAYYQALREYKKTKHKIAFGWYGSWTAVGASYQTQYTLSIFRPLPSPIYRKRTKFILSERVILQA